MHSILRKEQLNEVHSVLGKGRKGPGVRKDDTRVPCVGGVARAEEGEKGRPSEEGVLVRSEHLWSGRVVPAVDTLLEAYERVVKTLRWGYTHGLPRTFAKSRSLGPA